MGCVPIFPLYSPYIPHRGNGRQQVFNEDKEYEVFIELKTEAKTREAKKVGLKSSLSPFLNS